MIDVIIQNIVNGCVFHVFRESLNTHNFNQKTGESVSEFVFTC